MTTTARLVERRFRPEVSRHSVWLRSSRARRGGDVAESSGAEGCIGGDLRRTGGLQKPASDSREVGPRVVAVLEQPHPCWDAPRRLFSNIRCTNATIGFWTRGLKSVSGRGSCIMCMASASTYSPTNGVVREALVQNDSERATSERSVASLASLHCSGSHVGRCPHHGAGLGLSAIPSAIFATPKSRSLTRSPPGSSGSLHDHEVVGLEISVDHRSLMGSIGECQRLGVPSESSRRLSRCGVDRVAVAVSRHAKFHRKETPPEAV